MAMTTEQFRKLWAQQRQRALYTYRPQGIQGYHGLLSAMRNVPSYRTAVTPKPKPAKPSSTLPTSITEAYERANKANERRYQEVLGTYRDWEKDAFARLDDLARTYARSAATKVRQWAITHGLTGTRVAPTMEAAAEAAERRRLADKYLDVMARTRGGRARAIEARTDEGPDLTTALELTRQAAQARAMTPKSEKVTRFPIRKEKEQDRRPVSYQELIRQEIRKALKGVAPKTSGAKPKEVKPRSPGGKPEPKSVTNITPRRGKTTTVPARKYAPRSPSPSTPALPESYVSIGHQTAEYWAERGGVPPQMVAEAQRYAELADDALLHFREAIYTPTTLANQVTHLNSLRQHLGAAFTRLASALKSGVFAGQPQEKALATKMETIQEVLTKVNRALAEAQKGDPGDMVEVILNDIRRNYLDTLY